MKNVFLRSKKMTSVDHEPTDIDRAQGLDAQSQMVEGSSWMTIGSILSRILGVIYLIPWLRMMGTTEDANTAQALYGLGYTYYSWFITIATVGFPSATSKLVSHFNAQGNYKTSQYILKVVNSFMLLTGVIFAVIFWYIAPTLSAQSPVVDVESGVTVIRSLAPALLIIPAMSTFRGYLQGYSVMKPSALSQIVEQFARVIFILASTYLIRMVFNGSITTAVTLTTFAAFIGAIASWGVLLYYYNKYSGSFQRLATLDESTAQISWKRVILQTIKDGIPFVVIGSIMSIFQVIDSNTYGPIMKEISNLSSVEIESLYGIFNANINKLIMIIISLAISMSSTQLPIITTAYAQNRLDDIKGIIESNLNLYFFVMLPAAFGMAVVAEPLYFFFFRESEIGTQLLISAAIMAVFAGLYFLLSNSLLSMSMYRQAIIGVVIITISKLVLQRPGLELLGTHGVFWTSTIALLLGSIYYTFCLKGKIGFLAFSVLKSNLPTFFAALIMFVVCLGVKWGVDYLLAPYGFITSFVALAIIAGVGALVYLLITFKTSIADQALGDGAKRLRQRLRL